MCRKSLMWGRLTCRKSLLCRKSLMCQKSLMFQKSLMVKFDRFRHRGLKRHSPEEECRVGGGH
jgi:hypothetical protein